MRKFISLIAMTCMLVFASCTNDSFGIQYALEANGATDGSVKVEFVNGGFDVNGHADFDFSVSNVTDLQNTVDGISLTQALANVDDEETYDAACRVNEWLDSSIGVTDFSGTYDVYIKGYVMETLTQIKFSIDRRFTNLPEE